MVVQAVLSKYVKQNLFQMFAGLWRCCVTPAVMIRQEEITPRGKIKKGECILGKKGQQAGNAHKGKTGDVKGFLT